MEEIDEKNSFIKMNNPFNRTVIVADGSFPGHRVPLEYIKNAARIICCDGSAAPTVAAGYVPYAIIGDMDSLESGLVKRFSDRINRIEEQETNDLTKSVRWCIDKGFSDIVITGATGKREDHTIGNISLLAEYVNSANVLMVTDTGFMIPLDRSIELPSFRGQQISVFSIDCETEITSHGLKYPLNKTRLRSWWQATLNESTGNSFKLEFGKGWLIVYLKFRE